MICYKLTDWEMQTRQGFQYRLGRWTITLQGNDELCTSHWYHVYDSPLLAALFWPIHISFSSLRLFKCTYDGRRRTRDANGMKRGVVQLRMDEEITLPKVSGTQRARFAIYAAQSVFKDDRWLEWAEGWLNGTDRDIDSARSAADFAYSIRVTLPRPRGWDEKIIWPPYAGEYASKAAAVAWRGNNTLDQVELGKHAAEAVKDVALVTECDAAHWESLAKRAITDENKLQLEMTA